MSNRFAEELKKDNLCTYFILPLLKLNRNKFISSNFINSYLTVKYDCIVVKVVDLSLLSNKLFVHKHYLYRKTGTYEYLFYQIPDHWSKDIILFCKGEFSDMSEKAKKQIILHSGLDYRKKDEYGRIVTDGRLLALNKEPVLKEAWKRFLNVEDKTLPDNGELLRIPGVETFITEYD